MTFWAAALLATAAAAAPARKAAAVNPAPLGDSSAVDWLRVYPTAPYREYWGLRLQVRSLSKDLPRVMAALEKRGGTLTTPLANSAGSVSEGTQQLSYRLGAKDAQHALKDLHKIGKAQAPVIRPSGEKLPLSEIKSKLAALNKDKQEHGAELARMPAVQALVEAAVGHLSAAEAVAEHGDSEVVLNLTVVETPKAPGKKKG